MENLVATCREKGSVTSKKRNYSKRVRTPENIARVQSLEQSPMKSQRLLTVQRGIKGSCRNIMEKDMHHYIFTVGHELNLPDTLSRVEFCRWFLNEVKSRLLDSQFFISSDQAWFSLSGYVN